MEEKQGFGGIGHRKDDAGDFIGREIGADFPERSL